jgi:hypothetical protein
MKILLISLSIFAAVCCSFAEDYTGCFVPGEVSEYKVTWMGIPLAWSKTTTEAITENDRELVRIRVVSKTYKTFAHTYKVDDLIEVIADPKTLLPVRSEIVINEGSRHRSYVTTFDHENNEATFINRIENTTNSVSIGTETKDIITFLYSLRNTEPKELDQTTHELFVDGKIFDMQLEVHKEGRVRLPDYGKTESTKVEPIASFGGLFQRQGKIFFWVSKEKRRMVTYIEAKVPIGRIKIKLKKVSGPGNDIWVKESK